MLGLLFSFWQKTCNYVLSFFIFFPTNSSGIVLDMMSTLMKLTAAQRPSQTFLRLVSEASSCGSWLRPRRELIVFLAPRDLQRSTTTRTNTHHPFEASPVHGAIAWKSSKLPVNKPRPSLLSWGESYSTPAGRFWGKSLTKQRKVIKLHKTGTIPLTTLTRMLPLLCMLRMGREREYWESERREKGSEPSMAD